MCDNPLLHFVPRSWSPEQALTALKLLRQATEAVWQLYGDDVAEVVLAEPCRGDLADLFGMSEQSDIDDLPF